MTRLLTILLLFGCACAKAATVTAASASIGAVSNAMVLCAPGDTLAIPAGKASWTNGLYVTNWINIVAAGRGTTILSNAIPGGTADSFINMFTWDLSYHSRTCYFGNLTIANDPSQPANSTSQGVRVISDNSDGRRMCITNIHFTNLWAFSLRIEGALGVVSGCQFDVTTVAIYGFHANWNGGDYGHGAWATNDNFGTDQFWFIENCGFNRITPGSSYTTIDGLGGWRYVCRDSNFTNTTMEGHGPEAGTSRGTRAVECYRNTFYFTGGALAQIISYVRSGVQIYWSNNVVGADFLGTGAFNLTYSRRFENQATWGGVDGTNIWDKVAAGGPQYSGVATATNGVDSRSAGVVATGTPFSANQYRGYTIRRTADAGGFGLNRHSVIQSNTTTTLYYALGQNGVLKFTPTDTFELYAIDWCLDQHGRGKGGTASGGTPWAENTQEISACYEWGNTNLTDNSNLQFSVPDTNPSTVANTNYFNDTIKPGYTAYTYPHPLVSGAAPPPADLPAAPGVQKIGGIRFTP